MHGMKMEVSASQQPVVEDHGGLLSLPRCQSEDSIHLYYPTVSKVPPS